MGQFVLRERKETESVVDIYFKMLFLIILTGLLLVNRQREDPRK